MNEKAIREELIKLNKQVDALESKGYGNKDKVYRDIQQRISLMNGILKTKGVYDKTQSLMNDVMATSKESFNAKVNKDQEKQEELKQKVAAKLREIEENQFRHFISNDE